MTNTWPIVVHMWNHPVSSSASRCGPQGSPSCAWNPNTKRCICRPCQICPIGTTPTSSLRAGCIGTLGAPMCLVNFVEKETRKYICSFGNHESLYLGKWLATTHMSALHELELVNFLDKEIILPWVPHEIFGKEEKYFCSSCRRAWVTPRQPFI